jgi:hypothetical protein
MPTKNVYIAYQKTIVGLFWLHMQLWVHAYQIYTIEYVQRYIYDSIYPQKSSKGWDEGDHSCTIIAYTPKKGAKIHCGCIKNLA